MEVHHHAHTERKKWTHYFWEFLMLFLAVFAAFLAEYQLEHLIEHNREKEYMKSMVEDLQQDTTEINRTVSVIQLYNSNSDTLLNLLETIKLNDNIFLKKIYQLHYSLGAEPALLSQRTISQLKNAGGLRLIQKKNVADSITLYDTRQQYLSAIFKSYDETSTSASTISMKIFDNKYIRHSFESGEITLLTTSTVALREYSNSIFLLQAIGEYYSDYLFRQKELAVKLIGLIKKEYHLS